ncbi:MAG: beta-N-acetylhexosaminidase [Actinomycetota bacterium]|nr:beta-N-acetylhexosaminidase [Actinomycetota bacterium]
MALIAGVVAGSGIDEAERASKPPMRPAERREAPVDRLSLRQQVGQLLITSFPGAVAPDYVRRRLRDGEGAGVVLFGENTASREGLRRLTRTLQRSARGSALVAVDQEGGPIRNVPFTGPEQPQSGQRDPRGAAREAGRGLRALGINVTLAPVADAPRPGSVLAGRAFAEDPARSAGEAVSGYARTRVGATAKHFPGLGAATRNTDDAPVTIDRSAAELFRRDLPPFRSAIGAGTPLVMASHALYPALDRRRIASQSPAVLDALLRRRLGFRGVVITDSIEAEAVIGRQAVEAAAERSVAAGCDLILMTGSGSPRLVYPRLLRAARRSPAFRSRVRESAARVLALKRRLGLRPPS